MDENNNYFDGTNRNQNPDANQSSDSNPNPNPNPTSNPNPNGYQNGYQLQNGYTVYPQADPMFVPKPGVPEYLSLVLGILSVLICCCLGPVSLPFGVGAIVCALVGKSKNHHFFGVGIAGLILGIFGCLTGLITLLIFAIFLKEMAVSWSEFIRLVQTGEFSDYLRDNGVEIEAEIQAVVTVVRSFLH